MADTDDIVQVSLVRALSRVDEFEARREGAFLAYLHKILLNIIRDEIRRAAARPDAGPLDADLPDERVSILDRTIGPSAINLYEAALADLPERQQQAVILRVEFGFSFPEIAGVIGNTTPDAVRMLVTRGLIRLAAKMRDPRA
jgi:RNA polymerase sigma-70 factor (ECF subfamily)